MEENVNEEKKWKVSRSAFAAELKKEGAIAAPMVAVAVLQYLLQVVSLVMVGHLGELSLSSVAIAASLTNVTGFSLLSGMAGGLETLCGQAFGAEQFHKLGTYTYTAIISLNLVCPPVCVLWIFMDKFLSLIGQDPLISLKARNYSMWLIPGLFSSAILKPLTRYCQTQSSIIPMLLASFIVLVFHIPACWILVYKLEIGTNGAAIAFSLSTWLYVLLLGLYVTYSSSFERTRMAFSKDAFLGIREFFRLAVPSAVMFEMVVMRAAYSAVWSFTEPETGNFNAVYMNCAGLYLSCFYFVHTFVISLTLSTLHFTVPYGIGAAASTRVSNELGAGKPEAARLAVWAAIFFATTEAVIVSTTLFACRYVLGYAYTNEKQLVDYIASMAPLICISIFMDSLQAVLSGISRGSGWQQTGAYISLVAFYLVGLPVGAVLGFALHLKGKGLWIGIVIGSAVQSTLLSLVTILTNWKKQAIKARERVLLKRSSEANGSD